MHCWVATSSDFTILFSARPLMFSTRVTQIPQAVSIAINQLVYDKRRAGEDVIVLSLGEAFFDIPAFDFRALEFERGYHYSDSRGLIELRTKVVDHYRRAYGVAGLDPATNLLVTAGSKIAFFMAFMALLNDGDEVILHEPCWLSYDSQIVLAGGQCTFLPFWTPVEEFGRHFTPRTRAVVLNNPNNPSGRLYTESEVRALGDLCRSQGAYLLVDEAYSDFVSDNFFSAAELIAQNENVVVINSLSKNLGMSGWRIGYFIAAQNFIDQVLKLNQHLITCAATVLQLYVTEYFHRILEVTLPQAMAVTEKRNRVARWATAQLGLEVLPGSSTFYMFAGLGNFPGNSNDAAMRLIQEHNVAAVPGSAYGRSTDRYVRLAIGTESIERIQRGLTALKQVIDG